MYNKRTHSRSKTRKPATQQSLSKQKQYLPQQKIVATSNSYKNHHHNPNQNPGKCRSQSHQKERQTRIKTDYDQYNNEFQGYAVKDLYISKNKANQKKKSFEGRMRERKSFILGNIDKPQRGKSFNIIAQNNEDSNLYSTKNNQKKNLELKYLFKSKNQAKPQIKNSVFQHPIMKYFSNKNKYGSYQMPIALGVRPSNGNQIRRESPYARQISKFEQIYAVNRGDSSSKQKRRRSSNHKKSDSIGFDRKQLNLNKMNIKVDIGGINKSKIKTGLSNRLKHKKYEEERRGHHMNTSVLDKATQQQQQVTVKTIKKKADQTSKLQKQKSYTEESRAQDDQSFDDGDFGLTEQQQQTFGDRFPYGFQKVKLLGRGGFSLVWLGKHIKSGKIFAIKQIITQNTHQTHIKQIWFGSAFFMLGGVPKPEFSSYPGIKNLVRMYSYQINQTDTWIFYQRCGSSLGSTLYDIKSEKVYGEQRLYKIFYKDIYKQMSRDPSILRDILKAICQSLALLSDSEIVHSDLKTQNILIKYNQDTLKISEVKLIDYGSSFQFKNIAQFSMATPEYMPPQILNYIIHENQGQYEEELYEQVMTNYNNPWVVDIWSLGCVMLEMVVGVPLWMSLPLLVPINSSRNGVGSYLQKEGLFAVKGRLFPEIIKKQRKVAGILDSVIKNQNYTRIVLSQGMTKILKGMLEIDFNKRISPKEVIKIIQQQEALQKLNQVN